MILPTLLLISGFPNSSVGKESACNAGDTSLIPGLGRPAWRRERLPTPVFWPGEFHGLYSPRGHTESDILVSPFLTQRLPPSQTPSWFSLLSKKYVLYFSLRGPVTFQLILFVHMSWGQVYVLLFIFNLSQSLSQCLIYNRWALNVCSVEQNRVCARRQVNQSHIRWKWKHQCRILLLNFHGLNKEYFRMDEECTNYMPSY